jgi:hypothetical protein
MLLRSLHLVLVLQQLKDLLLPLTARRCALQTKKEYNVSNNVIYLKPRVYENSRIPLPERRNQRCPTETWRRTNHIPSSLSPLRRIKYDETSVH